MNGILYTNSSARAANGLSVKGGIVVLGNDAGDVNQPAAFANNREVPVNGFTLNLRAGSSQGSADIFQVQFSDGTLLSAWSTSRFRFVTPIVQGSTGYIQFEASGQQRPGATRLNMSGSMMNGFDTGFTFCDNQNTFFGVSPLGAGGAVSMYGYFLAKDTQNATTNASYAKWQPSAQSEFLSAANYPSTTNYYELFTTLNSPVVATNTGQTGVRAPIRFSARQLSFYTGNTYSYAGNPQLFIPESGNIIFNSTTDNGHRLQVNGNASLFHLVGSSAAPTIAAGTGAGTAPAVSVSGTDLSGTITVTTGTTPAASGVIVTLTFNSAFGSAPRKLIAGSNAAAASLSGAGSVVPSTTTTTLVLTAQNALAAATTYTWDYIIVQ